jgi:hypothetical protein
VQSRIFIYEHHQNKYWSCLTDSHLDDALRAACSSYTPDFRQLSTYFPKVSKHCPAYYIFDELLTNTHATKHFVLAESLGLHQIICLDKIKLYSLSTKYWRTWVTQLCRMKFLQAKKCIRSPKWMCTGSYTCAFIDLKMPWMAKFSNTKTDCRNLYQWKDI